MNLLQTYNITASELRGRCRKSNMSEARQMHWLIMKENGFHETEIAENFNRDRVTIIYGINRIKGLIEVDKAVRAKYELIKAEH